MFRGKFSGLPGITVSTDKFRLLSANDKIVPSLFQKKLNISISDHLSISFYYSIQIKQ